MSSSPDRRKKAKSQARKRLPGPRALKAAPAKDAARHDAPQQHTAGAVSRAAPAEQAEVAAESIDIHAPCAGCTVKSRCLLRDLCESDMPRHGSPAVLRRTVKLAETLFHAGDRFESLYLIRAGIFKRVCLDGEGREQIIGFGMPGELLGADGIDSETHQSNAVALEVSEVCAISFAFIEELACKTRALERQLRRMLSFQIVRDQSLILLLGSMMANERVAAFLLSVSRRMDADGDSPEDLYLHISREEIACFLGLKRETISRELSRLRDAGTIEVHNEHLCIRDLRALRKLIRVPALFS